MTEYTKDEIRENRRKWVAALRSGEYEQGTGRLAFSDPNGNLTHFCCLGVACVNVGTSTHSLFGGRVHFSTSDTYSETLCLPDITADALGLVLSPSAVIQGKRVSLTALNDIWGFSFEDIAGVIEAQEDDWDGGLDIYHDEWTTTPPKPSTW